jgi:uncharacterized protein (UPF0147 family)
MSLLKKLKNNKGTVSSALGKELAQEVLKGNTKIVQEAIELLTYQPDSTEAKNIRSGAAKIIEKVAEKKPTLITTHIDKLIAALNMEEPQTRWMAIRAIGFCASEDPRKAYQAIKYAKKFLDKSEGVCLSGATALYLGELGAADARYAKESLEILEKFIKQASINEVDWVLEAFIKIYDHIITEDQKRIREIAKKHVKAPKKSTQKRVGVILNK